MIKVCAEVYGSVKCFCMDVDGERREASVVEYELNVSRLVAMDETTDNCQGIHPLLKRRVRVNAGVGYAVRAR